MDRIRDARRGGGGGGGGTNNFSPVKRKIKQSGVPKFFSDGKLSNGRVKTLVGKASSRYQSSEMTCLWSDVDADHKRTPHANKKIKLHKKLVYDCKSIDHTPVPRKLRSAMKKRNRESISPPFQDSETLNHTMGGVESPKAILGSSKTSKMEMKQGDHITKDEEEVVETLFSLASMFSTVDTSDKTKLDNKSPEERPSPLGAAGDSSSPNFSAPPKDDVDSARPTTIHEAGNRSSNAARLHNEKGTSNDEISNKTIVPQQPRLAVHETFPRVDLQALCLQSCNFGVPSQQKPGNGLDWSKQLEEQKPKTESNPASHSVMQQEQRYPTIELQKEGRTLWPGLFTSRGSRILNPPQQAAATKYPAWLDTPKLPARPTSYQSGVSNEKVTNSLIVLSDEAEREPWKKCATHVHISRLIKDLTNSERNNIQISERNHFRPNEGMKPENLIFRNNVNEFSRVLSGGSAVDKNPNEARDGSLIPIRIHHDQQYAAAVHSGATVLQKQSFDFLSLSTGGGGHVMEGNNSNNKRKNGFDSFPQLPIPYFTSHSHNQNTRPVSFPQTCYSSSTSDYVDQLSAASVKQVPLHAPLYHSKQFCGTAQTLPCLTKHQQEQQAQQQRQQQIWAAQMGCKPTGLNSSTKSHFPPWQKGRHDSSPSLVPCAASNDTIISPCSTVLGVQGSLKYLPFSSQQQQFMAMTSSLGHANVKRQQHLQPQSFPSGYEKNEGDFRADSALHSRFL